MKAIIAVLCCLLLACGGKSSTAPVLPASSISVVAQGGATYTAQGKALTFIATVTTGATGTIAFYDGQTYLGTLPVGWVGSVWGAALSAQVLSAGPHSITANYSGDTNFAPSNSGALGIVIVPTSTPTVTLVSGPNPSVVGQSVTFTATVAYPDPTISASEITGLGIISFYDGLNLLQFSVVSNGSASISTSTLVSGSHTITAVFTVDLPSSGQSPSATLTQVVN